MSQHHEHDGRASSGAKVGPGVSEREETPFDSPSAEPTQLFTYCQPHGPLPQRGDDGRCAACYPEAVQETTPQTRRVVPVPPRGATAEEQVSHWISVGLAPEPVVGKDVFRGQALSKPETAIRSVEQFGKVLARQTRKATEWRLHPALGLRTGAQSRCLVDLDLDADGFALEAGSALLDEALRLFGIPTAAFGRASKPRSHRLLLARSSRRGDFKLGAGFPCSSSFVEVRGDNKHTVVPESFHTSGEQIEWAPGVEEIPAANVEFGELLALTGLAAFLALSVERFGRPGPSGPQHDLALRLARPVLESGALAALPREEGNRRAEALVALAVRLTGEDPLKCREHARGAVLSTRAKLDREEEATGLPSLVEFLGVPEEQRAEAVEAMRRCLHPSSPDEPAATAEQRGRLLDREDPVGTARRLREEVDETLTYTDEEEWLRYVNEPRSPHLGTYERVTDDGVMTVVQEYLERASRTSGSGNVVPFRPLRKDKEEVLHSLRHLQEVYRGNAPLPVGWIPGAPTPDGIDQTWHVVPVQNGLLCISARGEEVRLVDFTPSYRAKSKVAAAWRPGAECPRLRRAFNEWFGKHAEDALDRFCEFVGYSLVPWYGVHAALVLVGVPGGGKGTILRLWMFFVGGGTAYTTKTLSSFSDRYALASVPGKRLLVISDAQAGGRLVDVPEFTARLKEITGGDVTQVRNMREVAFDYKMESKVVLACNEVPPFLDSSGALFDRLRFMEFTKKFRNTEREDTHLDDALSAEVDGLLLLAVEGLRRVLRDGRIPHPTCGEEERKRFAEDSNPIGDFLESVLDFQEGLATWINKQDVFDLWRDECERNGEKAPKKRGFVRHANAALRGRVCEADRTGVKGWTGVSLKIEAQHRLVTTRRRWEGRLHGAAVPGSSSRPPATPDEEEEGSPF